ncbi:MAG TPA: phosphate acyltransferase PlsX [Bacillota bacterium]
MRIALDVMGGDLAPAAPLEAARSAAARFPQARFLLVGPEAEIRAGLGGDAERFDVIDAPEVIRVDEPPAQAVRRKPGASIPVGVDLVRQGQADALVSAGNTGALMVAATLELGTIPGVRRPALATMLPTWDGRGLLMLDLGAQVDCAAEHLVQFAVMGAVFMERVRGLTGPRVALLSIGAEAAKGSRAVREAHELLAASDLNFVGNVEARDLFAGPADVVVCDGFVGNAVLKAIEGTALGIFRLLRQEIQASRLTALGALLARSGLRRVRRRLDYAEYGGAPLLGVNGVVVKCHGSSDARAVANGIGAAVRAVEQGMIARIADHMDKSGKVLKP